VRRKPRITGKRFTAGGSSLRTDAVPEVERSIDMKSLNVWRFALAASVTSAALSAVCAVAIILWPDATVAVFNNWFHGLDLKLLVPPGGRPVTAGQFISGVVSTAVVAFVGGGILAGCYNLFGAGRKERP
jgi:hypothetical protein